MSTIIKKRKQIIDFESIKDMLGYRKFTTEEIIEKGYLSESSIAQIDKKMDEAHSVLCHFPIGVKQLNSCL